MISDILSPGELVSPGELSVVIFDQEINRIQALGFIRGKKHFFRFGVGASIYPVGTW